MSGDKTDPARRLTEPQGTTVPYTTVPLYRCAQGHEQLGTTQFISPPSAVPAGQPFCYQCYALWVSASFPTERVGEGQVPTVLVIPASHMP